MAGRRFERVGSEETTGVQLHPERLDQPLRWRKPRRVFVCSLADLFHERIPRTFLDDVFARMALASGHTFQVLTKRPGRARDYLRTGRTHQRIANRAFGVNAYSSVAGTVYRGERWPLPNVWLGVSIENARYTWRADVLRGSPAAVRFISAEPLLGSLVQVPSAAEEGGGRGKGPPDAGDVGGARKPLDLAGIDWLIVGGESGPGARPMHPAWVRELRDACLVRALRRDGPPDGVLPIRPAFFFKQWGGRVGKKAARVLDGREWNEMPR